MSEKYEFDIEEAFRRIALSEDLRQGTYERPDDLVRALRMKLDFGDHILDTDGELEEFEEELVTFLQRVLRPLGKDYVAALQSDPEKRELVVAATDALEEVRKLLASHKASELTDDDFDLVNRGLRLASRLSVVRTAHDVAPLLRRGLYASALRESLEFWRENQDEGERVWQAELSKRGELFKLSFGAQTVILQDQAHVGGTSLSGAGDKITDFMLQHSGTKDVALVEIKAPKTELLNPLE